MRADAFRAFLAADLDPRTIGSYLAYLRRLERVLDTDLDLTDTAGSAIETIGRKLAGADVPVSSVRNCQAALRRYDAFKCGEHRPRPKTVPSAPVIARPEVVTAASVPALMRLYADILDELRDRSILRTSNAPVGDYAEWLFARAFGWTLTANSNSGHDAEDNSKARIQIKARRLGRGLGGRQMGVLRQLEAGKFDMLAAVLFDRNMAVFRAALIPHGTVMKLARPVEWVNGWRFHLNDSVWALPGVDDVTAQLRAAEDLF